MKDTFLTVRYKDGYIHSCQNRTSGHEEVRAHLPDGTTRPAKSRHAAKILITRSQK